MLVVFFNEHRSLKLDVPLPLLGWAQLVSGGGGLLTPVPSLTQCHVLSFLLLSLPSFGSRYLSWGLSGHLCVSFCILSLSFFHLRHTFILCPHFWPSLLTQMARWQSASPSHLRVSLLNNGNDFLQRLTGGELRHRPFGESSGGWHPQPGLLMRDPEAFSCQSLGNTAILRLYSGLREVNGEVRCDWQATSVFSKVYLWCKKHFDS